MRYAFERWYIDKEEFNAEDIMQDVAGFFFTKCDYCEFSAIMYEDKTKYEVNDIITEEDKKLILSCLDGKHSIDRLIISPNYVKDDKYIFEFYDSIYNWNLLLDSDGYEEFKIFLKGKELPQDLFFSEDDWQKIILNNPIDRFLSLFGFTGETSRFYTPRQYKELKKIS